ncbi:hypothetical protein FRUB_03234 [Fimbriiglobus ruber]|uniref:Uncharacterized protein n=1 Tax=Fimbriiglobus ruber TaxID=1908690 RepID=A0A225E4M2_9BACT|nr:hypothetical protein FRUB_03234 [Fimbriiglobus ruber]
MADGIGILLHLTFPLPASSLITFKNSTGGPFPTDCSARTRQ